MENFFIKMQKLNDRYQKQMELSLEVKDKVVEDEKLGKECNIKNE